MRLYNCLYQGNETWASLEGQMCTCKHSPAAAPSWSPLYPTSCKQHPCFLTTRQVGDLPSLLLIHDLIKNFNFNNFILPTWDSTLYTAQIVWRVFSTQPQPKRSNTLRYWNQLSYPAWSDYTHTVYETTTYSDRSGEWIVGFQLSEVIGEIFAPYPHLYYLYTLSLLHFIHISSLQKEAPFGSFTPHSQVLSASSS